MKAEADFIANTFNRRYQTCPGRICGAFRSNQYSESEEHRKSRIPYLLVGANSFYRNKEILDAISFLAVDPEPSDDFSFRALSTCHHGNRRCWHRQITGISRYYSSKFNQLLERPEVLEKLPVEAASSIRHRSISVESHGIRPAWPTLEKAQTF